MDLLRSLQTKNKIFFLAGVILVLIALPLTIYIAQKQQEIRQRASETSTIKGVLQNANCIFIEGWACDIQDPDSEIDVALRNKPIEENEDSNLNTYFSKADQTRRNDEIDNSDEKIKRECKASNAKHKFYFPVPEEFKDGQDYTIYVYGFNRKRNVYKLLDREIPGVIKCVGTEPTKPVCAQVITPAKNPTTAQCKEFPTPCDVPNGWEKVQSCAAVPTPTCIPRPSCLDTIPRCLMPEPVNGWCTVPTPTIEPTVTPIPGSESAALKLSLILPGIGGRGNTNPVHKTRNITVCIYDPNVNSSGDNNCDKAVLKKTGTVSYDEASGDFINTNFDLGNISLGQYQVLVKMDQYLRKKIPVIVNINNPVNEVLPVTLTVGDINNDNLLNIADYNLYTSCFGDKSNTQTCLYKNAVDLNDDGKVDDPTSMLDYRLLFSSFQTQSGD